MPFADDPINHLIGQYGDGDAYIGPTKSRDGVRDVPIPVVMRPYVQALRNIPRPRAYHFTIRAIYPFFVGFPLILQLIGVPCFAAFAAFFFSLLVRETMFTKYCFP